MHTDLIVPLQLYSLKLVIVYYDNYATVTIIDGRRIMVEWTTGLNILFINTDLQAPIAIIN